ncbi:Flavohemoprotein [Frondihabitans sp. 762G35]|uniref:FAD-binding oxidoreductase n=1 Tax=Frondihabitans sp. 762G35 TaxID=1446794 RepID=UPI000D2125F9|nr:FAD-binding oxidoreductase [Frondihabitans sp. 762G35]ARC58577.1 Flavohemoprotein [Frondihabitans sp. 762G35]
MTGSWRPAVCVAARTETPTARSIRLRVDGLGPVVAGQHIDIRLTADDGYQAVRSYSLSATPVGGPLGVPLADDEVEITVEELPEGEVSPYLVQGLEPQDALEVRGPIGGWFVWRDTDPDPVQLIGGGSGVAPLVAMLRARVAGRSPVPMRLLTSVRTPESLYFGDELRRLAEVPGIGVDVAYSREAPAGEVRPAGRLTAGDIAAFVQEPGAGTVFVCGRTSFVAAVTDLLIARGHDPASIRTERFGGA